MTADLTFYVMGPTPEDLAVLADPDSHTADEIARAELASIVDTDNDVRPEDGPQPRRDWDGDA